MSLVPGQHAGHQEGEGDNKDDDEDHLELAPSCGRAVQPLRVCRGSRHLAGGREGLWGVGVGVGARREGVWGPPGGELPPCPSR